MSKDKQHPNGYIDGREGDPMSDLANGIAGGNDEYAKNYRQGADDRREHGRLSDGSGKAGSFFNQDKE